MRNAIISVEGWVHLLSTSVVEIVTEKWIRQGTTDREKTQGEAVQASPSTVTAWDIEREEWFTFSPSIVFSYRKL
jgi:hypothetical protein